MTTYQAPIDNMLFLLEEISDLQAIASLPGYQDVSSELVKDILGQASKFAGDVLDPINGSGDSEGCLLENGVVSTPAGFVDAYRAFVGGGWNGLAFPVDVGGAGLPRSIATAVSEMWHAANMSFGLCPLLTASAVELLRLQGTPELKDMFLRPLVEGTWTGTMNLTEPHAGSDLSKLSTRAEKDGDIYRLFGQKIYITYGDHDLAENIVHMVLARTPDAPPGVKGISLFLVPKFLTGADGTIGARNDIRAASLEHKLGIRASPTAVMLFGENEGAVGYLVGDECRGLEYMFIMMNHARLAVGLEGVAIAERAYQDARAFADERRQGRSPDQAADESATIVHHPDVKRMLLEMRAKTDAARCLAYWVAGQMDISEKHPDPAQAKAAMSFVELLTPVVKSFATDVGVEVASLGIQVHGGMGYIEETGAAQHFRDARIAPIYEGTNGIQAIDLVGRKVARDKGAAMGDLIRHIRQSMATMSTHPRLSASVDTMEQTTAWICQTYTDDRPAALAGASDYLQLVGITVSGWLMVRALEASARRGAENPGLAARRLAAVRYMARHVLVTAPALGERISTGSAFIAEAGPDAI